jgi:hypothetical protein
VEQRIDVSADSHGAFERARNALIDDPVAVLAERCPPAEKHARRFRADLAVELTGGASVHQEVLMEAGLPTVDEGVLTLPLQWKATGREGLFPTFVGNLEASPARTGTRLRLVGTCTLPLGWLGRFGDEKLGHRAAERSLSRYLEDVATRLQVEVHRRTTMLPGSS